MWIKKIQILALKDGCKFERPKYGLSRPTKFRVK